MWSNNPVWEEQTDASERLSNKVTQVVSLKDTQPVSRAVDSNSDKHIVHDPQHTKLSSWIVKEEVHWVIKSVLEILFTNPVIGAGDGA
jgi:hypothetical protein